MPQISIITVNKDNASGLIKTVESVVSQTYTDYEWIVIDAASTDSSVSIIQQYESYLSFWISEPDDGIYNAMNKGVCMATGDYLLFLNAGDIFSDKNVVKSLLSVELLADIVIGRVNVVNDKEVIVPNHTVNGEISLFSLYLRGIPHQGTLIRRDLLLKNPYDEYYRINSDFKFFVETIILQNKSVQYIPLTIANYDALGISSVNQALQVKERKDIYEKLIPQRIRTDYDKVFPHYYEIIRIEWLLRHPLCYRIYRGFTTFCRKLLG